MKWEFRQALTFPIIRNTHLEDLIEKHSDYATNEEVGSVSDELDGLKDSKGGVTWKISYRPPTHRFPDFVVSGSGGVLTNEVPKWRNGAQKITRFDEK